MHRGFPREDVGLSPLPLSRGPKSLELSHWRCESEEVLPEYLPPRRPRLEPWPFESAVPCYLWLTGTCQHSKYSHDKHPSVKTARETPSALFISSVCGVVLLEQLRLLSSLDPPASASQGFSLVLCSHGQLLRQALLTQAGLTFSILPRAGTPGVLPHLAQWGTSPHISAFSELLAFFFQGCAGGWRAVKKRPSAANGSG